MRSALSLLFFSLFIATATQAQDIRYVSDKQYVPLRSGAGNDYRITHRGIPSGTRMKIARTSSDGVWAEITTDRGTTGWIRTQYLMKEAPAQNKLDAATQRAEQATAASTALAAEVEALKTERVDLLNQITSDDSTLDNLTQELNELKQISGKSVQLDDVNVQTDAGNCQI